MLVTVGLFLFGVTFGFTYCFLLFSCQLLAAGSVLDCFTINTIGTPQYVRIRPYYEQAALYAVPAIGQVIPRQGIIMDARGYSGESVKHITVLKTDPMAPAFFDYALLQTSGTSDLTNSYGP